MKLRTWIAIGLAAIVVIAGCRSEAKGPSREGASIPSEWNGISRGTPAGHPYQPRSHMEATIFTGEEIHYAEKEAIPFLSKVPVLGLILNVPLHRAAAAAAPAPGDELWVIEKSSAPGDASASDADSAPGSGALLARRSEAEKEVPCPLEHTDVRAHIVGYVGTVDVTQRFKNPFAEKIEAVYVFPLPHDAAVNDFVMTIGDRHIRGIVREREEAKKIYEEARSQGYVASLLEQDRPNIFTQKVANIEPGKSIDVAITYIETLSFSDGAYEFVFPMVVGPRFNPPGTHDGVGAVPRGGPGSSSQTTEVSYLAPGERTGHDIAVAVDLEAGLSIEDLASPSHAIKVESVSPTRAAVILDAKDTLPNKDFVLRWRVAGGAIKTALLTHRDERGGFFTLMISPPADLATLPRAPQEMVFLLDCSGSMDGRPIAKAKSAIRRAIGRLGPEDTFQIIQFSETASALGPAPIPATSENVERGLRYLASLTSEGGTMMIEGIKAALDFPHDPRRFRIVSFMTDGYIGNEAQIFAETAKRLGESRLFSFGVGSSVNRYLLDGLARMGRGAVAYVGLEEDAAPAVDGFYERIAHPALTDVKVDFGGLDATDVFPSRVPDLFVGRPIVLTGRFTGHGRQTIRLSGMAGGERREVKLDVDLDAADATHPGLASVWARMEIKDLSFRAATGTEDRAAERIKSLALEYGLMSAYTSFIAVDTLARTAGDHGTTVTVPVPMPAGVRYETTVPDGKKDGERPK